MSDDDPDTFAASGLDEVDPEEIWYGPIDEMLAAALDHARHGRPVFPLWWPIWTADGIARCACPNPVCDDIGKHPITAHGLKDATCTRATILAWWRRWPRANIGVATGAATFDVLDVDPGKGGDVTLARLEQMHGPLPETAETLTGGGGRHLLFQPSGLRNSQSRIGPGLDIRGDGGYVVGAVSVHKSRRRYEPEVLHALDEVPLAAMPAWLRARASDESNGHHGPAATVEPTIPEGQRNGQLASIAGTMRRRGLSEMEMLAALLEVNRGRCTPPLPEAEVRTIAASVGRYAPADAPALTAEDGLVRPAGVAADHTAAVETDPATIWADGRALYQRVARPVAHLVEGIIPAVGTVLVTGEDKAGKSTISAALVLSYLYGLPFLGRHTPRAGRAIIVSEEDDGDELRDRLRALHHGLAVAHPDQVLAPDHPASLELVADRLIWEAREGLRVDAPTMVAALVTQITLLRLRDPDGPPVLVLIDSLQAVRGLLDPAKTEGVAVLKLVLRQLVAAGAVVVLIAHARKIVSGGKRTARASQEIAGNHELAAEAAATIGLMALGARADAPVRVDLVSKRGKSGTIGYLRIAYHPPDTWPPTTIAITVEAAPDVKARTDKTDSKVLEALRSSPPDPAAPGLPGVASTGQPGVLRATLQTATKLSEKTVRDALNRLIDRGQALVVGITTSQAKLYAVFDETSRDVTGR